MNPSDVDTLTQLATEMKMDVDRFITAMQSETLESELIRQVGFSRQSPIDGFPSLALDVSGSLVSVQRDYLNSQVTLDHIKQLLS